MNYRVILIAALCTSLFWAGCKEKAEDIVCLPYNAAWQAPAQTGDIAWLFVSDEEGRLLLEEQAEARSVVDIVTEECSDSYTLSFVSVGQETVTDGGNPRQETVYRLTTIVDADRGFRWDTLSLAPLEEWEVSVANITSLERLVWPAERRDVFQGDIVLDPAADVLGFSITARGDEAAYFELSANGALIPRGLFFPSLANNDLSANFNSLLPVFALGEVELPNTANWRYSLYGFTDSTHTLLDYSSQPDLVNGSFVPRASTAASGRYRLQVEEPAFYEELTYNARTYDFITSGFPIDLPTDFPEYAYQRKDDQLEIITLGNAPLVYQVRIFDYTGPGPWLDWTIYGTPEALANFKLPDWPESLATQRELLLGEGRATVITIRGKRFRSGVDDRDFLRALSEKNTRWPWEQGLMERTVIWDY